MEFADRNIVVTGAGRGIGEVAASLERATAITADVSTEAGHKDLVDRACSALGSIDLFFCNAGVGAGRGVVETPEDDWDLALAVTDPERWLGGMRKLQRRTIGA